MKVKSVWVGLQLRHAKNYSIIVPQMPYLCQNKKDYWCSAYLIIVIMSLLKNKLMFDLNLMDLQK